MEREARRFLLVISNENLLFTLNIKYNSLTFPIKPRGGLQNDST